MDDLDPGICKTVNLLCAAGFDTTDSGDGVSKPDMACALPYPHVFAIVDPARMVEEAQRLLDLVSCYADMNLPGRAVEVSYSPIDGVAVLMLIGLRDEDITPPTAH
jgi:hypothetical protein